MPITVNRPNIYYECEQCGHVWMVAPTPLSRKNTSGPLSKNRNDDFS
jgi:hypothetical protein